MQSVVPVLEALKKLYPDAGCTLDWKTPLDLLVATILSAQCTDRRVNIVTKELFRKYRTPEDYLKVPQEELERDIRSCGYYRAKARAIRESCAAIIECFDGRVPKTMAEMVTLRGVGRKTASVVLSTVYGVEEGIAVDTHVMRVSRLLGLTKAKAQAQIERDLMRKTPREDWSNLSHLLIAHGRATCIGRKRRCGKCAICRGEVPEIVRGGVSGCCFTVPASSPALLPLRVGEGSSVVGDEKMGCRRNMSMNTWLSSESDDKPRFNLYQN